MYFVVNSPNLMDIPDILVISIDLLYKLDIPNIYGTYMVFIVIIIVNPDTWLYFHLIHRFV